MPPADPWVTGSTIALFLATLGLCWIGFLQYGTMQQHAEEFKHLKTLADAATNAALAADKSANAMIGLEKARLLARVNTGQTGLTTKTGADWHVFADLRFTNLGRATCQITEFLVKYKCMASGDPMPTEPDYGSDKGAASRECVVEGGKSAPFSLGMSEALSEKDLGAINEGKTIMYIYGWIAYDDAVSGSRTFRFGRIYTPHAEGDAKWMDEPKYNNAG